MQTRTFGRLDWRPSALGFGAMRLPVLEGDTRRVDEPEVMRMIRYAIDQGVNYVDTAYGYHGGNSEIAVGKALQDGYRQRVRLATKLPTWLVKGPEDFDRFFDEQLRRLQTDRVDFYLLHSLDAARWRELKPMGILKWAERQKEAGRIGELGFSFHDTYQAFEEIVDAYDHWTMCQLYYNFLSEERQAGTRGLRYAAARGLGIVIMGPISGGMLSANPPPAVQALWDTAARRRSAADWALQWVWDHPEVSVVLSGMTTMQQVVENVGNAGICGPGTLSEEERSLIGRVRDLYFTLSKIPCTECKYCQPCPQDVAIPEIFTLYNAAFMHNAVERSRRFYRRLATDKHGGDRCVECGDCEKVCPQQIAIIDWLPKVHAYLGEQ